MDGGKGVVGEAAAVYSRCCVRASFSGVSLVDGLWSRGLLCERLTGRWLTVCGVHGKVLLL